MKIKFNYQINIICVISLVVLKFKVYRYYGCINLNNYVAYILL